jgi:hypothetical protein
MLRYFSHDAFHAVAVVSSLIANTRVLGEESVVPLSLIMGLPKAHSTF